MKFILHIDIDAFFPSIAKLDNPKLINKPVVIGNQKSRGVISSACYVARKYGLKAGMPNFKIKKLCPQAIYVPLSKKRIDYFVNKFRRTLFSMFNDQVLVGSVDECYVDVTDLIKNKANKLNIINNWKIEIFKKTNLKVSIGVSNNLFLAKMATKYAKPFGVYHIYPDEIESKLWPIKIEKFHGIGRTKWETLLSANIKTIGDFAKIDPSDLFFNKLFGKQLISFIENANGKGKNTIIANDPKFKSISFSRTFLNEDITTSEECLIELKKMIKEVWKRLINENYVSNILTVSIKYNHTLIMSKRYKFDKHIDSYSKLLYKAEILFNDLWNRKPIRLIGVALSNLINRYDNSFPITIFSVPKKINKIDRLIHQVNKKFKKPILTTVDKMQNKKNNSIY